MCYALPEMFRESFRRLHFLPNASVVGDPARHKTIKQTSILVVPVSPPFSQRFRFLSLFMSSFLREHMFSRYARISRVHLPPTSPCTDVNIRVHTR
jgi:hypothetical protein